MKLMSKTWRGPIAFEESLALPRLAGPWASGFLRRWRSSWTRCSTEESYLYLATDGSSKNAWCHGFCFPAAIHPPCLRYGGTSKVKISTSTPGDPSARSLRMDCPVPRQRIEDMRLGLGGAKFQALDTQNRICMHDWAWVLDTLCFRDFGLPEKPKLSFAG